jgi:hypothetical protein
MGNLIKVQFKQVKPVQAVQPVQEKTLEEKLIAYFREHGIFFDALADTEFAEENAELIHYCYEYFNDDEREEEYFTMLKENIEDYPYNSLKQLKREGYNYTFMSGFEENLFQDVVYGSTIEYLIRSFNDKSEAI